jgi:hypothetical protein
MKDFDPKPEIPSPERPFAALEGNLSTIQG